MEVTARGLAWLWGEPGGEIVVMMAMGDVFCDENANDSDSGEGSAIRRRCLVAGDVFGGSKFENR